ncbi:hypothetical protein OG216_26055 [Streptomycetaceae bacterium NBC_01309]
MADEPNSAAAVDAPAGHAGPRKPADRMTIKVYEVGPDGTTLIRTVTCNFQGPPTWGMRR